MEYQKDYASAKTKAAPGHSNPPATKWFQTHDDSDSDQVGLVPHNRGYKLKKWGVSDAQFGGNRLRAPRGLREETEYTKGGKRRPVLKRKRRYIDDDLLDEEEDPYKLINMEDILSPIETPTDVVRRPALRRIMKSPQIEALTETAMEFIESEKNFNKILCRLAAILHNDDPRYLDLSFERPPDQRKKLKSQTQDKTDDSTQDKKLNDEYQETQDKEEKPETSESKEPTNEENTAPEADTEAQEVVKKVKELLLENINFSNEYLSRLH
ncbi:uncharacterized protein BYT42DRAFT_577659, partial [Radiomyces spectabilis]|uniref:uncharacterized protein n=1 Tax=Radiomyces spectabilis TaxID=64574 RepID=UPI0022204BFB